MQSSQIYDQFKIDLIYLDEVIYDQPHLRKSLEGACKRFEQSSCKKVSFNTISKYILDNLSRYKYCKYSGKKEINTDQTLIIWVTNLVSILCILFPFIERLLYKRIKLYCYRKYNLNETANHAGENVNLKNSKLI